MLISIDGVDIGNYSTEEIAPRLLGAQGSLVLVKFRRQTDQGFLDNTIAMDRRPTQQEAIAFSILK